MTFIRLCKSQSKKFKLDLSLTSIVNASHKGVDVYGFSLNYFSE